MDFVDGEMKQERLYLRRITASPAAVSFFLNNTPWVSVTSSLKSVGWTAMESWAAVWLCVMVLVWGCTCVQALAQMHARGVQGLMLALFFCLTFSLNALVVLTGQQAPVSHHPSHPLGLEMYTIMAGFPMVAGDGNSGSHACTANILLTAIFSALVVASIKPVGHAAECLQAFQLPIIGREEEGYLESGCQYR